MHKNLLLIFICFLSSLLYAQKQQTTSIEGKTYFVYPHNIENTSLPFYATSFKKFEKLYDQEYDKWIEEEKDSAEKEQLIIDRKYRKDLFLNSRMQRFQIDNWVKNCKKQKEGFISRASYSLKKDITPSLDPLKDGEYVQFFDPMLRAKNAGWDSSVVAGKFSVKNGALNGFAIWYYENGDTARFGNYKNGLKDGKWVFKRRIFKMSDKEIAKRAKRFEKRIKKGEDFFVGENSLSVDEIIHYKNGMKHGKMIKQYKGTPLVTGHYKEDAVSGKWNEYFYELYRKKRVKISEKTFDNTDSTIKLNSIIRYSNFNTYMYYKDMEKAESYDFDIHDYYKRVYNDENYFSSYSRENEASYQAKYKDTLREWYYNGQLKWEIIFEDYLPKEEPIIYYDNGQIAVEVKFNEDSLKYFKYEYDYFGDLTDLNVYDSTKKFLYQAEQFRLKQKVIKLEGVSLSYFSNNNTFLYMNDTLFNTPNLKGRNFRTLRVHPDSTIKFSKVFNADTRTLHSLEKYENDTIYYSEYQFDTSYTQLKGFQIIQVDKLREKSKFNGFLNDNFELVDTLPKYQFLSYMHRAYDITFTKKLFVNDEPFNGQVNIHKSSKSKNHSIKVGKNKLDVTIQGKSQKNYGFMKILKTVEKEKVNFEMAERLLQKRHRKKGNDGLQKFYQLQAIFDEVRLTNPNSYSYFGKREYPNYSVIGQYENGKKTGDWNAYRKKNLILLETQFKNGEQHGYVRNYLVPDKYDYEKDEGIYLTDEYEPIGKKLPKKYLASEEFYSQNLYDSVHRKFDILGNTIEKASFKKGLQEGPYYRKGEYYFIKSDYHNGYLDGKMKIFMTTFDTVLMSELMFQNGDLSGKSYVYHPNGQIAKKAFFLDGKPIETYEAFDSLGQLYHYVKFEYGFVSEEKIWEENQLSARYEFNWEDSIQFNNFKFITNDDYFDRIMYEIGGMGNRYYAAYKGRPSAVKKEDEPYYLTKYYPDNTKAREGKVADYDKVGPWDYFHYEGHRLYHVDYFDTTFTINDSIELPIYGKYIAFNKAGDTISKRYIIEMKAKYDCANTDHYELRQFYIPKQENDNDSLTDGYVKNYYDNGVLQNEGRMKDGLAIGVWKFYDPYGKINQVGEYVNGQREGRWLKGDLGKVKFLGDICLNPNLPNLEKEISQREKQLDIKVTYYHKGDAKNTNHFDLDLNKKKFDEGIEYDYRTISF